MVCPELYCEKCWLPVRAVPGVQKKDSRKHKAGTKLWRCPKCNKNLGVRDA